MNTQNKKSNNKLWNISYGLKAFFSTPYTLYPVPSFKKLVPGLILFSFVLSGLLAPVSIQFSDKYRAYETKMVSAEEVKKPNPTGGTGTLKESAQSYTKSGGKTAAPAKVVKSPFSCGFFGDSNVLGCVGHIVWGLIYIPSTYIITLSGWLFDITLAFTLSTKLLNLDFVRDGWVVTRDLANMFFIFILLYIAIATILEIAAYNAKALLARLIIVALLLNFSLFATRVVIDASNILALAFYNRISSVSNEWDKGQLSSLLKIKDRDGTSFFTVTPKGISAGLTAAFSPQNLAGSDEGGAKVIADFVKDAPGKLIFIFLFSAAILLTAAWAFFSVAFLFITRTAVLWFLMATAPIAFAAIILPKTRGLFEKWWGELVSKSFCVAIFLFFLWLITEFTKTPFIKQFSDAGKGGFVANVKNLYTGQREDTGFLIVTLVILLQFSVLLVMILVAKQQTQKMCGAVAGFSMNFVSGLGTKAAGFLAGGVGGAVLRRTLGAYAYEKADKWNKAGYGGGGLRERLQLQAARKLSSTGYDVRATKLGGVAELGKASGQKGYTSWIKERTAKDVAFAKSFGPGKKADAFRAQFSENVENMGIFSRMITGRGILTTQQKKSAKEIDKLVKGTEKTTREENRLDDLRGKALNLSKENPIKAEDNKGALRDFDNIKGLREAVEKGEVDLDTAERTIDDAVDQRFEGLRDKLDNAKGQLAKVKDWGSPEEREEATINVSKIQRLIDSEKEIKRLSERKERRTREEVNKAEREASQKPSSGGGDKDKK